MLSNTWIWLVLGVALCGTELLVGSFYLLVVGVGCLAAATMSFLGLDLAWQITAFSVTILVGGVAVRQLRTQKKETERAADILQNLDIGQTVMVDAWQPNRTAEVRYRGTQWTVESIDATPVAGLNCIERVRGSRLMVRAVVR